MPPTNSSSSEPFGLDFILWAKEIAKLSLRYSNLKGYQVEDFQENVNLGYFSQAYIDSIEALGISTNPKLQFINSGKLHHIYYVDKNATGNASGSSWINAAISVSALNLNNANAGDTVYVSGGIDSTIYPKDGISNINISGGDLVIANGNDTRHNGKVIFSTATTAGSLRASFIINGCTNIKLTGLTLKWEIGTTYAGNYVAMFNNSDYCCIDNCHIISNGNATGITAHYSSHISITNNNIESLSNNYTTDLDQDGINIGLGDGGHTITGNTIILRGKSGIPHTDGIQFIWEGSDNNYETIIANNFYNDITYSSAQTGSAIYYNACYTNRLLIYNNIFVYNQAYREGLSILGNSPNYHTSATGV